MSRGVPFSRLLLAVSAIIALAVAGLVGPPSASAGPAPFTLRPGNTQLEVLNADGLHGATLDLLRAGQVVATGTVDSLGSLVWRKLDNGTYTVRTADASYTSAPVHVKRFHAAPPPHSFYAGQSLGSGFGFIKTRDGTTLSANVVLPGPANQGPYPTVVEYSGYDPSNPANTTFSQIFNLLGFAYVGVNVRGTGCSGGSYLPFEPVQSLDGYDAIETIAAQPWVKSHKVGMVGISYPGIEQLYVAGTQPPHLSAITPLSVIDDTYRGTLWPGGILNTGFATPWATQRAKDAAPYGEGWEAGMNSPECDTNQRVRLQNPDPVSLIEDNPFYNRSYYQQIDPTRFAHRIDVPVYIAGAWQDEQTGGHWPDFLHRFTGSPHVFATLTNGSHTESLDTLSSFARYTDFLDLYVAHRVPLNAKNFIGPALVHQITGIAGVTMPPGHGYSGDTYAQAKRWYQSRPPVQVQFEEGAAAGQPSGAPVARFVRRFSSWPIPGTRATRLYLRSGGALASHAPSGPATARSFSADPSALPATDYTGSDSAIWGAHPTYDWRQIPKGKGLGWITTPLRKNVVMIGNASLDVWVRTPAKDVDLEATVSDVRPGGREVYVQSGWLRASHRRLNLHRSTVLRPVHTDRERDARDMPIGRYQLLRIEIPPFAQPFRAGDRIRVTLDAPGGAKPLWAFQTLDHGQRVTVATDRHHPSSLVLPVVPGVSVPRHAPPCRSLRSQPCRTYPG